MRAQQVVSLDGPDGLQAVDVDEPGAEGRVIIDVVAAGVSFPDLLMSRGQYQVKPPVPFTPGVEVSGTVRTAPPASGFAAGDRVMAATLVGGFAERAAADPALTVAMPERLSFEAAAGFIMNYHTAHVALARRGRVRPGETVLVHGAGGGVGSAALQVARGLGARAIAVVSDQEKAQIARQAGADDVLQTEGWTDSLRQLSGGRGVDVVLDPVGGDRFDDSIRSLAPEGRLIVVGFAEGRIPSVQVNRVLFRNIDVIGAAWGALLAVEPALFATTQDALNGLIETGAVAPVVGAALPFERAADALRMLQERRALGKVVLTL